MFISKIGRNVSFHLLRVWSGLMLVGALIVAISMPMNTLAAEKNDSVFAILDTEITKRKQYSANKESKINAIRKEYANADNYRSRFEAAVELFSEYRCYQSDSAYHYGLILENLATREGSASDHAVARLALMDYYTSVGFFKEVAEIKDKINKDNLPAKYLAHYYNLCNRYLQNIAGYVGGQTTVLGEAYDRERIGYLDSLISVLNSNTGPYHIAVLERSQIDNPSAAVALKERQRILSRYELTDHEKAVQYSLMGRGALDLNQPEEAKKYLALSAIHDIRGNIKETTAAKMLAELLFSEKKVDESYKLIHIAFDDASFYNSHLRKDETSSIMRMIEVEHHNKMSGRIWLFAALAGGVFVLLLITLFLFSKLRKKKKEAEEANLALKQKSDEINSINQELKEVISKLQEVTEIKDKYITQSLYMNTAFVNSVEAKSHEVVKQLKDKKYDAIKYLPYELGIKEERARIYQSFDKAFLSLFPNFITEFNKLFGHEDQPVAPDVRELPVEVRIFALLRLGISDPQEVAKYLNLSVKTIYVYKTKLKSRSIVDNADFEARVMAIPKP